MFINFKLLFSELLFMITNSTSSYDTSPYSGRTRKIASIAIFAAVAAVIRIQSKALSFPFPLLPALKFELWEIPIVVGLLLYGPTVGFSSGSIILIIGLIIGSNPTGQIYNFIAFSSMMLGIIITNRLYSRNMKFNIKISTIISTFGGILVRVLIQVPVMLILLPLPPPLGFNIPLWNNSELMFTWITGLIIFNVIVAAYTIPISYGIERSLIKRLIHITWIRLPTKHSKK